MMKKTLLVMLAALPIVGCSYYSQDELQTWMDREAETMKGNVPPVPPLKNFPPVAFTETEAVSPFNDVRMTPEQDGVQTGLAPDQNRPKEPLEAFPLESMNMVGILRRQGAVHALIAVSGVPGAEGLYQVKVGHYIGQDYGLITAITEESVTLREMVNQDGQWEERTNQLLLQQR